MILLRREMGDALRERRRSQGRTLREVSASAAVSLGYLSEVERGEKEASSELLAAICTALEFPMSNLLLDVSSRLSRLEAPGHTRAIAEPVALPVGRGRRESAVRVSAA